MGKKYKEPMRCFKVPEFNFWNHFRWVTFKRLCKNYETIPLVAVTVATFAALPVVIWYRLFVNTIDVKLIHKGHLPRYEIQSEPAFYDLRNPRTLKWVKTYDWKPCIHLDNRYRLMRGEPMLDADGNKTDEIGVDETGFEFEV